MMCITSIIVDLDSATQPALILTFCVAFAFAFAFFTFACESPWSMFAHNLQRDRTDM